MLQRRPQLSACHAVLVAVAREPVRDGAWLPADRPLQAEAEVPGGTGAVPEVQSRRFPEVGSDHVCSTSTVPEVRSSPQGHPSPDMQCP